MIFLSLKYCKFKNGIGILVKWKMFHQRPNPTFGSNFQKKREIFKISFEWKFHLAPKFSLSYTNWVKKWIENFRNFQDFEFWKFGISKSKNWNFENLAEFMKISKIELSNFNFFFAHYMSFSEYTTSLKLFFSETSIKAVYNKIFIISLKFSKKTCFFKFSIFFCLINTLENYCFDMQLNKAKYCD